MEDKRNYWWVPVILALVTLAGGVVANWQNLNLVEIITTLFAEQPVEHRVAVTTGTHEDADGCELVYVTLTGTDGVFKSPVLDHPGIDDFQRGATDTFVWEGKDIGELTGFRIDMSNNPNGCKGGGTLNDWQADSIVIDNLTDGRSTGTIALNAWLGDNHGASFLERNASYRETQ